MQLDYIPFAGCYGFSLFIYYRISIHDLSTWHIHYFYASLSRIEKRSVPWRLV